ncbi:site-specific integrase [Rhodanobacter umsongensis]|uniref:Site-specific integrase n=1 Tax=Rhodanobacter umsongensis TaxID=633153 RepID=A0ABW0JME8_9GAMM
MTARVPPAPLTQKFLDTIKPGAKQVDYPDGFLRGLALRSSPGGALTWVLVKRLPEGVRRIVLGRYTGQAQQAAPVDRSHFPAGYQSLSLKQAREEAARVLAMIAEGRSPAKEKELAKHVRAVDSALGSFRDLLHDYVTFREAGSEKRAAAGERQIKEWNRIIALLDNQAGAILDMPARDVEPAHIVALLRPIFHHGTARPTSGRGSGGRRSVDGAQGAADKVQTFLRAAFAHGLSSEHSVARKTARRYGLVHNPAAPVPREAKSTPGTRALSAAELRQFWWSIDQVAKVGPVMAGLLRFTIASGGQRAHQLAREPWASYDTQNHVLSLVDRKGRGGMKRVHLVPMTSRMVGILKSVHLHSGQNKWPWSTSTRAPIDIASPASAVRYFLKSEHAFIDGVPIAPFTPRDLRRTCAQIMQAAGIPDIEADRLQSHGVAGVTGTHYRNNPELYLPEKKRALDKFDEVLGKILIGKSNT